MNIFEIINLASQYCCENNIENLEAKKKINNLIRLIGINRFKNDYLNNDNN